MRSAAWIPPALTVMIGAFVAVVVLSLGPSPTPADDPSARPGRAPTPDLAMSSDSEADSDSDSDPDSVAGSRSALDPFEVDPDAPFTLGDDPALDVLWAGCEAGDGAACDELFERSPVGSDYEDFGVTCGRRSGVLDCAADLGPAD